MTLTKGEYCQFSLRGRLRLLRLYGLYICSKIITTKKILLYRMYDFYVAVIKDLIQNIITEANPVWTSEMVEFYMSL